jgi:hypothetical protein
MAWWSSGADPNWKPPRLNNPRPLDRIRDKLNAIIGDETHGELWLKALAERLPAEAIESFLDSKQMTPGETAAISGFVDEFGRDMATNRLCRRPAAPPVSLGPRP